MTGRGFFLARMEATPAGPHKSVRGAGRVRAGTWWSVLSAPLQTGAIQVMVAIKCRPACWAVLRIPVALPVSSSHYIELMEAVSQAADQLVTLGARVQKLPCLQDKLVLAGDSH